MWFPDSAFKTSQAISDFSREHLPLIVFANWRGFSGGMKGQLCTETQSPLLLFGVERGIIHGFCPFSLPDMYDQVLKFGAYIVDALRTFRQPVLVYIPPHAELRGGSWVVIDPTINPLCMELYADRESRWVRWPFYGSLGGDSSGKLCFLSSIRHNDVFVALPEVVCWRPRERWRSNSGGRIC